MSRQTQSQAWVAACIRELIARGADGVEEAELYRLTGCKPSVTSASHLFEHPSIRFWQGMVYFRPFTRISTQKELLATLRAAFPRTYRRIDLLGLYEFVESDLEELLFCGSVVAVEAAVFAPPARAELEISCDAAQVWRARLLNQR